MSTAPEPGTMTITLKDVWYEMTRLREEVAKASGSAPVIADHEVRVRALERWRYALPTSMVLAVGSVGVTITGLVIR